MTEQEFLTKMKEDVLDTEDEISMDTDLLDIEERDSLSFVSFIAMVKVATGKKLELKAIQAAETVQDLYNLFK